MAITTGDTIDKFGTQDEVTTSPASVADGAFSIASDTSIWTNDDDAQEFMAVLFIPTAGFSAAPNANSSIDLFLQAMNVQSTNDQREPSANFLHRFIGSFRMDAAAADNAVEIGPFRVPNGKSSAEFTPFIRNQSGVTISNWQLFFVPIADGEAA